MKVCFTVVFYVQAVNPPSISHLATSSLDADTERRVLTSLQSLFSDRTLIIIAHRLSSVAHCDEIVVLDEGRVAQSGSHSELLVQDGKYRHLFSIQNDKGRGINWPLKKD
jgi:ABC-type multidrug transport system fused ATPase/permease subunit